MSFSNCLLQMLYNKRFRQFVIDKEVFSLLLKLNEVQHSENKIHLGLVVSFVLYFLLEILNGFDVLLNLLSINPNLFLLN